MELAAEGLQSNRLGEWHLSFRDCVWSLPSCAACVTHLRMRHTGHWGGGQADQRKNDTRPPPSRRAAGGLSPPSKPTRMGEGKGAAGKGWGPQEGASGPAPPGPAEVLPALQGAGAVGGHAGGSVMLPALWEHGPRTRAGLPLSLRDPDSTLSGARRLQKPVAPAASSAASFHH